MNRKAEYVDCATDVPTFEVKFRFIERCDLYTGRLLRQSIPYCSINGSGFHNAMVVNVKIEVTSSKVCILYMYIQLLPSGGQAKNCPPLLCHANNCPGQLCLSNTARHLPMHIFRAALLCYSIEPHALLSFCAFLQGKLIPARRYYLSPNNGRIHLHRIELLRSLVPSWGTWILSLLQLLSLQRRGGKKTRKKTQNCGFSRFLCWVFTCVRWVMSLLVRLIDWLRAPAMRAMWVRVFGNRQLRTTFNRSEA